MVAIMTKPKTAHNPNFIKLSHGGYSFKRFSGIQKKHWFRELHPDRVTIPLCSVSGQSARVSVRAGHFVRAGDIIAQTDLSLIHASITGRVEKIGHICLDGKQFPCATIRRVHSVRSDKNSLITSDNPERLLYLLGMTEHRYGIMPLHLRDNTAFCEAIHHIIINAICSQPPWFRLSALWDGHEKKIVGAIKLISSVYKNARIHIVVDKSDSLYAQQLSVEAKDNLEINVSCAANTYPISHPNMLIGSLLNKQFHANDDPSKHGVLVLDPRYFINLIDVMHSAMPQTTVVVAFFGLDDKNRGFVRVPIGTPLGVLLKHLGVDTSDKHVIDGGLLSGTELTDFNKPVTKRTYSIAVVAETNHRKFLSFMRPGRTADSYTNCFLSTLSKKERAVDTDMHGGKRPCISCGHCAQVCPIDTYPNLLYNFIRHNLMEEAIHLNITRCIDCGLCSYVCPSKLALSSTIKKGQEKIYAEYSALLNIL